MVALAVSKVMQHSKECRVEPVIFDGIRPEICPLLERVILDRMQNSHGRRAASINVGGWKSGEDFFTWPDPVVQELRQAVAAEMGTSQLVGWAMVNRGGSHHPRHQHRGAILTGIYYVTSGSEDAITPTVFECPSGDGCFDGKRYALEVEPHPGRLVICRGETWHFVPVYPGDMPRITIAFDVRR